MLILWAMNFSKKSTKIQNIYIYRQIPSGIMMINDIQEKAES
jgi:hypothetical protein